MALLQPKRFAVIGASGLAVLLWASAFAGIRAGLTAYTPLHLAFLRLVIGSIGLAVFAVIRPIRLPDLKDIPVILLIGFVGFTIYHAALNVGEITVSAGMSSLIVSLAPVFTGLLAAAFLHERLLPSGWLGTMISFLGVALISIGTGGSFQFNYGALWVVLAAFSESVYFVLQAPLLKKYGSLAFTTYAIWAGTLFMVGFSPGIMTEIIAAPLSVNLTVVYLGLFPTVIAYVALAYTISRVGSSSGSSAIYLTPVLAFLIAWIWMGEVPGWPAIIGGIIILVGVALVNKGTAARGKKKSSAGSF